MLMRFNFNIGLKLLKHAALNNSHVCNEHGIRVPRTKRLTPPMHSSPVLPTLAMFAVLTMASMSVFAVAVLAPEIATATDINPAWVGAFMAITYIFAMLAGTITGNLVDRYGAIRVCQLTLLLSAASLLALSSALLPVLIISAVVLGMAYGSLNPASAHILIRLGSARWRPLIFSIKQTGVPAGGALAGAVLPWLVIIWGWRGAAWTIIVMALLVLLSLQPLRSRFDQDRAAPRRLGLTSVLGPIAMVLGDPVLRRLTLVAFAYAGCQVSVGTFYVVYLVAVENMTLTQAGSAFAFVQIGGIAGRILWGWLAGRWIASRALLALIGTLTALSLIATTFIQAAWPFALIALQGLVLGASSFGWNGVFLSEAASLAPEGRAGDTTGGVQFVMFGGVVVVPPLFGLLAGASGSYTLAFYAVAAVALTAVIFLLLGRRQ